MRVGVGFPNTTTALSDLVLDWATQADEDPSATLGVLDRLVYDSYEPLPTLAAAAAVTRRIGLATTIIIGPL
jgi:alkanesulfonate monooxygenase SsuD/methylene tetrahydromethanopterin reductase-like flavin-dependent oxidoreductase (luciferase family)